MVVPLLREDIDRIVKLGYPDMSFYQQEGSLRFLIRIHDKCVFQEDEWGCGIYPFHPLWCKFYPLIYSSRAEDVVLDPLCPYSHEFTYSEDLAQQIRAYVARLAKEVESEDTRIKDLKTRVRGKKRYSRKVPAGGWASWTPP